MFLPTKIGVPNIKFKSSETTYYHHTISCNFNGWKWGQNNKSNCYRYSKLKRGRLSVILRTVMITRSSWWRAKILKWVTLYKWSQLAPTLCKNVFTYTITTETGETITYWEINWSAWSHHTYRRSRTHCIFPLLVVQKGSVQCFSLLASLHFHLSFPSTKLPCPVIGTRAKKFKLKPWV